ncbi:hypothetical protein J6Z19_07285 [bacterium]|nr:hypothetical protein [bacterium]
MANLERIAYMNHRIKTRGFVTLPIGEYHNEIISRVMKYSPECEIVSPPSLRKEWLDHIKSIYEKYCK